MNALLFILRRQLKNIIRGLAQKPLALIGYILIGILMLGSVVVVLIMPSGAVNNGSDELFSAGLTGLVVIALYFSLRQGIENGSTYFRFSDVNLVFTAPMKSSKVLLYGFIKHMGTSLLIVLFTIFQIPNIKNNFMLKSYGIWLILLTVLFYSLLYPILGMVLYTFSSENRARRNMAKRVLDVLMALFVLGLFQKLMETKSLADALIQYLNLGFFQWMPLVGQLKTIGSAAVYGVDSAFYISILILAGVIAALVLILYKTDPDYYEDVLGATEQHEKRIKAKREGRDASYNQKKARKVKGGFSSRGPRVIFEKHLLEYRKTSYILFFDKASLFVILAGIGFKYIIPRENVSILYTLFFSAYVLFFFVVQGKWPMELEKHYIFLIPAGNGKKLLYTTLTENIKNVLDGILLFVVSFFVYESRPHPLVIVLCIVSYTLYGAVYIYGDVVSRRLFGSVHSKAMQIFIKLFVSFFVVIPGAILGGVAYLSLGENELIALLIIAAWNLIAAGSLFLAAKGIFKNIEVS